MTIRIFQLTAAISASPGKISKGYDIQLMAKYMDAIHIMAYDLHGSWEKTADHHAPLYARYFAVSNIESRIFSRNVSGLGMKVHLSN